MSPVLAHQGGWDEMLVAAGLVLVVMGIGRLRRRRDEQRSGPTTRRTSASGTCPYCGEPLPEGVGRCSSCGFRIGDR